MQLIIFFKNNHILSIEIYEVSIICNRDGTFSLKIYCPLYVIRCNLVMESRIIPQFDHRISLMVAEQNKEPKLLQSDRAIL